MPADSVVIANITATDADSGDNGRLSYQVFDDSGQSPIVGLISHPGYVLVVLTGTLNYEGIQRYNFTVRVSDNGSPQMTTTAAVHLAVTDVNDNDPVLADTT